MIIQETKNIIKKIEAQIKTHQKVIRELSDGVQVEHSKKRIKDLKKKVQYYLYQIEDEENEGKTFLSEKEMRQIIAYNWLDFDGIVKIGHGVIIDVDKLSSCTKATAVRNNILEFIEEKKRIRNEF